MVRFHSISVSIHASEQRGRTRYTIACYKDGQRQRRMFADIEDAKRGAKLAAEKIMRGMQAQNDLRPAERESFLAAQRILKEIGMPLVAAVEDYVQCRKMLTIWFDLHFTLKVIVHYGASKPTQFQLPEPTSLRPCQMMNDNEIPRPRRTNPGGAGRFMDRQHVGQGLPCRQPRRQRPGHQRIQQRWLPRRPRFGPVIA